MPAQTDAHGVCRKRTANAVTVTAGKKNQGQDAGFFSGSITIDTQRQKTPRSTCGAFSDVGFMMTGKTDGSGGPRGPPW